MIDQLTVFLENEKGRLAAACQTLADAGINLHALNLADTADFGVVRLAKLLSFMDEQEANIEYGYCFSVNENVAIDVLKVDGDSGIEEKLKAAGFEPVRPEDIYDLD